VAGRQIAVALPFPARHDLTLDRNDVLMARLRSRGDGRLRTARAVEDDLDEAAAIAHRQEDQVAQVAPPRHPALQKYGLARVGGAQRAGRLSFRRHRSLPAPSRSASCAREKVCCSPVDRSLIVIASSSRSRDPRSTAWIPLAQNAYWPGSLAACAARASPLTRPRAVRSLSTTASAAARRISSAT